MANIYRNTWSTYTTTMVTQYENIVNIYETMVNNRQQQRGNPSSANRKNRQPTCATRQKHMYNIVKQGVHIVKLNCQNRCSLLLLMFSTMIRQAPAGLTSDTYTVHDCLVADRLCWITVRHQETDVREVPSRYVVIRRITRTTAGIHAKTTRAAASKDTNATNTRVSTSASVCVCSCARDISILLVVPHTHPSHFLQQCLSSSDHNHTSCCLHC
jgi:hypothetical protein